MITLAKQNLCTGCGACAFQCPKSCISMKENEQGVILPTIDTGRCVECHACEKICPILSPLPASEPKKSYAAWSNDAEERRTSASGGVAIELYRYGLEHGYLAVGASQNNDFSVTHKVASTQEELVPFKNSKYVFSDAYDVYQEIKTLLKADKKVLFIGLPCQVAALRKLFRNHENLFLADVVCHGTTPLSYLKQHIQMLERQAGKTAVRMSFRDPSAYTYTFTFTLYDADGNRFYAKRTKDGDTYQFGYHRAVSYRENCYNCRFARRQRMGDITLSDYNGLGKMAPCSYNAKKVSNILVNTEKGTSFLKNIFESNRLHADERPVEESIAGNSQLRQPIKKTNARLIFEEETLKNVPFEDAIVPAMKDYIRRNKLKGLLVFKAFRKLKHLLK